MYYPNLQIFRRTSCCLAAFFFFSIFLFVYPVSLHAEENILLQTGQEYRALGYAEQQKGNYDRALTCYAKAISMGAKDAEIYNDMGVIYEELGILARAEENYLQAITQDPNYLPAYTNLAYFYKDRGDNPKAVKYFQERYSRAADNDPWKDKVRKELENLDPEFKNRLIQQELETTGVALQQKHQEEFAQEMERVDKHYQLGQGYLANKEFDKALTEFDRALYLTPTNPKLISARQETVYAQKMEEVKKLVQEASQKLDAGELDSAKEAFQKALATIPSEVVPKSE